MPFNGATLPDNMPVYELEDAALNALDKWLVYGVAPPHGNEIATTPLLNLVERDQYGNALGGIRLPDIQVPTEPYSAIDFYLPSEESLSPSELLSSSRASSRRWRPGRSPIRPCATRACACWRGTTSRSAPQR